MDWLTRDWDQHHWIAATVGLIAGVTLSLLGKHGISEVGAVFVAVGLRWSMWQIPPPGKARASGAPPDAWSRVGQLAVTVLLVTLVLDLVLAPAY